MKVGIFKVRERRRVSVRVGSGGGGIVVGASDGMLLFFIFFSARDVSHAVLCNVV